MERMNEDDSCFLLGPVERERWTYSCAKQLLERVIWAQGQTRPAAVHDHSALQHHRPPYGLSSWDRRGRARHAYWPVS